MHREQEGRRAEVRRGGGSEVLVEVGSRCVWMPMYEPKQPETEPVTDSRHMDDASAPHTRKVLA